MDIDSIEFTGHALMRMAERGISKAEVIEVLLHPREIVDASEDRFEARGLIERGGKIRSLTMKIEYDSKADAIYIRLSSGIVADSDEVRPNVFLDTDADGRVLGIEMLAVSKLTDKPNELAWEMLRS